MSKIKLTRRRFLLTSSFLGVGAILGGYSVWVSSKESDIIVAILKRRLGKLNVEQEVFEQYANELIEKRKEFKSKLKILSTVSSLATVLTPYSFLPMKHPLRRIENYTVSNFLLSTDFFQNGADVNKPIRYFGFYDPYKRPCANFFQ